MLIQFLIFGTSSAVVLPPPCADTISSGTVTIPGNTTVIPENWFTDAGCITQQVNISIPASVTLINESAFENSWITGLTFESGSQLETIGKNAFKDTNYFSIGIIIPARVTTIESEAFYNSEITGLTFESGSQLETIGAEAFSDCGFISTSLVIPANVTTIGQYAFAESGITGLTFESGSKLGIIYNNAFSDCVNLVGNITIPANVTKILDAFQNTGITGLTFESESQLELLSGFQNCNNLVGNIEIPANVVHIDTGTFKGTAITGVTFQPESKLEDLDGFEGTAITELNLEHTKKLKTIAGFKNCVKLSGAIEVPASVIVIHDNTFFGTNITKVNFEKESKVQHIGFYAFSNCTNLETCGFPEVTEAIDRDVSYSYDGFREHVLDGSTSLSRVIASGESSFSGPEVENLVLSLCSEGMREDICIDGNGTRAGHIIRHENNTCGLECCAGSTCPAVPTDSDDSDDSELSMGAIIGISIGGFAGLVFLVVLIRHYRKGTEMLSASNTKLGSLVF